MSFHIVSIDSPQCSLACKDGRLVRKAPGEPDRSLPLEDIASIIITSFSAQIHSHLFLEAAKHGVALIICEDFKPVSLVLPANRSTDTLLTRALLKLDGPKRERLWQATVDAKCRNQHALAEHLAPGDAALPGLRATAFGKKPHKEGICAKAFWSIWGRALSAENGTAAGSDLSIVPAAPRTSREASNLNLQLSTSPFTRERASGGLNSLLNYGYAVLLSTVLQKLFGVGLDPTFGVSHVPRERSTPLAYDLMEPFRPCVDARVAAWARQLSKNFQLSTTNSQPLQVTPEFRKWVTAFPLDRVEYLGLELNVQSCIEGMVRGFRRAVLTGDLKHYRPWITSPTHLFQ